MAEGPLRISVVSHGRKVAGTCPQCGGPLPVEWADDGMCLDCWTRQWIARHGTWSFLPVYRPSAAVMVALGLCVLVWWGVWSWLS